jgi:hypothetical protein
MLIIICQAWLVKTTKIEASSAAGTRLGKISRL